MLVRRWNPLRDWLGRGILAASGVSHGSSLCVGRLIGLVFISGVAAGSGSCSAGLTGTAGLRGAASGSSAATAQVSASFAAQGVTFGASFGAGPLGGTFAAKGTTFSASSARGALGGTFALQGVAHGAARSTGGVSGVFLVSGYTAGASRGIALLAGSGALKGVAAGAGGAHGILGAIVPIYGITRGAARGFLSTLLPLPTLTIRQRHAEQLDLPLFRPERIGSVYTPETASSLNRMMQAVQQVVRAVRNRFDALEGSANRFRAIIAHATSIPHGSAVRIIGGDESGVALVARAKADSSTTMPADGIADVGASATQDGLFQVVRFGIVRGLNTSGWAVGDKLYVGTDGLLTTTQPLRNVQHIASVSLVSATDGMIWVECPGGAENGLVSYVPPGVVAFMAWAYGGSHWLPADGGLISRTTYAGLFAAIGTTYGVGDGSTTFNKPNIAAHDGLAAYIKT